jgi:D-threo-aldose 1-dehydrogenase
VVRLTAAYWPAAPADVVDKANDIRKVCVAHNVLLAAAAMQFPLGHEVVCSVIPGPRSPQEMNRLFDRFKLDIPAALWSDLKSEGLLRE